MPLESIVVSVLVIAVFLLFAGVLAYGERQTRNFRQTAESTVLPALPEKVEPGWHEAA